MAACRGTVEARQVGHRCSHEGQARQTHESRVQRADSAERARLLAELDALRSGIIELESCQPIRGAMATLGLDNARLQSMQLLLRPDRHGNSAAATEAAKWANGLRDVLKAQRTP